MSANAQPLQPVGVLLARTFAFYRQYWRLVLAVTLPVAAFVDLCVGAGLGELTAGTHKTISTADGYLYGVAAALVTVPLITAMLGRAVVVDLSGARRPRARDVAIEGLDLFAPVFAVVLIYTICSTAGLVLLIVPGIYLAVSWYFVVQAVVVDGERGLGAVRASVALVRGYWWHTAAVGVCFSLVAKVPALVAASGFASLSGSVNSDAVVVFGNVLIDTITLPFIAIGATLYYLELRERAGMARPR
jgi:hypothetical protein